MKVLIGIEAGIAPVLMGALVSSVTVGLCILLAFIWGFPAGLGLAFGRGTNEFASVGVDFCRSLPPSALIPVAILLLGTGRGMFIALSTYSLGLVLAVVVRDATRQIGIMKLRMIGDSRAGAMAKVLQFYLPSVLPSVEAASQILVSLGLALIIVCEMFLGSDGLGYEIRSAQLRLETPVLYSALIVGGFVGVLLNALIRKCVRRAELRHFLPMRYSDGV